MDPNIVNLFRFKGISKVPWRWSTLYAGDCIFVPAGYLHQVRSYGRSISITLEFSPMDSFDDTGCQLVEDEFVPLSDAIYLLTYENGVTRLTDTDMDEIAARDLLLNLLGRDEALGEAKFTNFYETIIGKGDKKKGIKSANTVYNYVAGEDDLVTRRDVISMDLEKLGQVAHAFNQGYAIMEKERQQEASRPRLSRTLLRGPKEEL